MDILQSVLTSIKSFAIVRKVSEIYSGLVVPVLIGVLAAFQDKLILISPFAFWFVVIVLILTAIAFTIAGLRIASAPEVYLEWQKEKAANTAISRDIKYFALLEQEVLAMNSLVREFASKRIKTEAALAEAVTEICSGFVEEKAEYFHFDLGERWNFAVYWLDKASNTLKPIWREKSRNHPSKSIGRAWPVGDGHVGRAFKNKRNIFTDDALVAGVADLMTSDQAKDYDVETYRAYVSIPILARDRTKVPYGVLVATSNRVGRFDLANSRVLNHAAAVLATLAETAYDSP